MKCKHTKVQNALINMLLTHWWSKWSKYAQHSQCFFLSRDHYKLTSPAQSSIAFTSSFMFTWLIVPLVPTEQPWQCFELLEVTLNNPGLAHVHPRLPDCHHLIINQFSESFAKKMFTFVEKSKRVSTWVSPAGDNTYCLYTLRHFWVNCSR